MFCLLPSSIIKGRGHCINLKRKTKIVTKGFSFLRWWKRVYGCRWGFIFHLSGDKLQETGQASTFVKKAAFDLILYRQCCFDQMTLPNCFTVLTKWPSFAVSLFWPNDPPSLLHCVDQITPPSLFRSFDQMTLLHCSTVLTKWPCFTVLTKWPSFTASLFWPNDPPSLFHSFDQMTPLHCSTVLTKWPRFTSHSNQSTASKSFLVPNPMRVGWYTSDFTRTEWTHFMVFMACQQQDWITLSIE